MTESALEDSPSQHKQQLHEKQDTEGDDKSIRFLVGDVVDEDDEESALKLAMLLSMEGVQASEEEECLTQPQPQPNTES